MRIYVSNRDKLLAAVLTIVERQAKRFDEELAEIRDGLVDLDHAKAPVARLNELHTRVDEQGLELHELKLDRGCLYIKTEDHDEMIAGLTDDITSLRNDYRGETT